MEKYKVSNIFVPGGLPNFTYNPRNERQLEQKLLLAKDNLCKLVMVTGSTKSGKTVLTNKIFPKKYNVWYEGGAFSNEEDFWLEIISQLQSYTELTEHEGTEKSNKLNTLIGADGNFLLFKPKVEGGYEYSEIKKREIQKTRKSSPKAAALDALRQNFKPLIIDDFHYVPREEQGLIVRAIKSLIFEGLPVIFIAIPHRKLDAVKVEREMTGRVETIEIPTWELDELKKIPEIGFPYLNVKINTDLIETLAKESVGSPHLMQEFCRAICYHLDITITLDREQVIDNIKIDNIFKEVAENTGKIIFDKLSKGPRQRSDRLQRTLKNGTKTDIYGVVLYALAELKPGIESIDYEELRAKIRNISQDKIPQAHEVSRVLDHMANIAAADESSTPVIDWEKKERRLHITDPFFAYYLKWGINR